MKIRYALAIAIGCLVVMFSSFVTLVGQETTQARNWPEFRGPTADGHATDSDLPIKFSKQSAKWMAKVHGRGWSSPVVWDQQIWLTTATEDGRSMSVLCFDLESGEKVHDKVVFENENPADCHSLNSYATPTPVLAEGKVFVHFGSYGTACLDSATGEKLWERRDLQCDHFRGPASSPILFNDKLFVAFDGFDQQYVVAMDAQTGDTVWKVDRNIEYGTDNGDRKKAYGTAAIVEANGKTVLVYPSAVATIAYDPETGDTVWTAYHGGMNVSARPVVSESGVMVITNGMGRMIGVRVDGQGDVTKSHVEWVASSSVAKKSSPLIVDELIYMVTDEGIISCVDVENGKTLYRERAGANFAASPIYANGRLYFFSMKGDVFVLEPARTYNVISQSKFGSGFMASPAVSGNKLILRSKTHLYCFKK